MNFRSLQVFFTLTLLTGLFINPALSQSTPDSLQIKQALFEIENKGGFYAAFKKSDAEFMKDDLRKHISIDYIAEDSVFAYINRLSLDILIDNKVPFTIKRSPGDVDFDLNMKTWEDLLSKDLIDTWDFYPTYEAYENLMYQFEQEFPELCKVYNVVTLASGRSILFAKLTANVNVREAKPRFSYTSTMHGDETVGFILSLRLIHYLLNNYGVDDELTWFLDNMEIWISPNENPDGTYTNNNNTVQGATRGNANGVDLNRNYPNPVNNPTSAIQAETQAMMNLTDTLHFVMSANMHGGIELVNYPWDSWKSDDNLHADTDWWLLVSHEYADTARFYSPPNYMNPSGPSFNNGVTHGGDWYVVYGSRQDFMNYYRNQRELTLELSNTKLLPPSQLPVHWEYNYRSFLNYMRQATYGIRGTVTDMFSGEPLAAKIELIDHDVDNSHVFSELPFGDFYRPVKGGTYNLLVTAEGYNEKIIENVTTANYETVELDIQLIRDNPYAPPTNLVAHTGNNSQVYLEWDAPEPPAKSGNTLKDYIYYEPDAYYVYRNGEYLDIADNPYYFDSDVPPGLWEYYVKAWYADPEGLSHPSNTVKVAFSEPDYFTVNFQIINEDNQQVNDAYVSLDGQENSMGDYYFLNIAPGSYDYLVWADSYFPVEGVINVEDSDVTEDVLLLIDNTGFTEVIKSHNFRLFPNPASNRLQIAGDVIMDKITLVDISGRQLKTWLPAQSKFDLDISEYSAGVYLIGIFTANDVVYKKLQIQ